jgi:cell division protein FtsN
MMRRRVGTLIVLSCILGCGGGPKPLPQEGFRAAFSASTAPLAMKKGQTSTVDVTVKNLSSSNWPSKPDGRNRFAVHLSYHWLTKNGEAVIFDGLRTLLPHDLEPRESVTLKAMIQAPETPGSYNLEITMVQEQVAWFPERGGEKLVIPAIVSDDGVATAQGSTIAESPDDRSRPREAGKKRPRKKKKLIELSTNRKVETKSTAKTKYSAATVNQGPWFVQVVSFPNPEAAERLAKKLAGKGFESYIVTAEVQGITRHRVRVGRLNNRAEAEALQQRLKDGEKLSQTVIAKQ